MAKAKKKGVKKKAAKKVFPPDHYVEITNGMYGKALKGTKIHYEGKKPDSLKPDGAISFGKHILELLGKHFKKFQWIITADTNSIQHTYGVDRIRTSIKTLNKMYQENIARSRDIKLDIVSEFFSIAYPGIFTATPKAVYTPGTFAKMLKPGLAARLSPDDKEALNKFLPEYIAAESYSSVNLLKASAQIKTLKELSEELKAEISKGHSESWWQSYIKANILIIQQGYIKAIEKINAIVGGTKYPDFTLITHDSYLDILEIKKPDTTLLKHDTSRDNYHWDLEMSKAIIQTENYIEKVSNSADPIRSYIRDKHDIELKIVRPRGIILAGNASLFSNQKQKDDFRLLTQAHKNILFVTYDELLSRLQNYISVLEQFSVQATSSSERQVDSTKKKVLKK